MFEALKRWWRSRGFGIHSPSAYRFVREVLCPQSIYGYYAYDTIAEMAAGRESFRELCMLYRVLVDIRPHSVTVLADDACTATAALALPGCTVARELGQSEFAVIAQPVEYPSEEIIWDTVLLLGRGTEMADVVTQSMREGHIFKSPKRTLIMRRARIPLETFELNF